MVRACYLLRDSFNKINRMASTITEKHDVENLRRRISIETKNTLTYFNEITSTFSEHRIDFIINAKRTFTAMVDFILNIEDPMQIKNQLENLVNSMPSSDQLNYLDEYDLNIEYKQKQQEYDYSGTIDEEIIKKISSKIKTFRKINMLDCRAMNGFNGKTFKDNIQGDVDMYAMEEDSTLANILKNTGVYYKIAKGGLEYSKCSNQVFDIVLHVPKFTTELQLTYTNAIKASNEALDIRKVTPYLQYGGTLIYHMHKYRLNTSMMTYISKNFEDVSVLEEGYSMITIVAKRKVFRDEVDETIFSKLRNISIDKEPCDNDLQRNIKIEGNLLEVKLFRGSILDEEDVIEIVSETKLIDNFLNSRSKELESFNEKNRPLLPFNLGQIGLVLTSGCLDGEIEELGDQYHVIKGAVKKESVEEVIKGDTKDDDETVITHINKVQIKILTPDGTIKTLA